MKYTKIHVTNPIQECNYLILIQMIFLCMSYLYELITNNDIISIKNNYKYVISYLFKIINTLIYDNYDIYY